MLLDQSELVQLVREALALGVRVCDCRSVQAIDLLPSSSACRSVLLIESAGHHLGNARVRGWLKLEADLLAAPMRVLGAGVQVELHHARLVAALLPPSSLDALRAALRER